jgi:flagellar biosynthesis/type III secretory pathway M-ring protein FliF/YscJ
MELLRPGAKVSELEAALASRSLSADKKQATLPPVGDENALRDKARDLGKSDPTRAAHLLRAWVSSDGEKQGAVSHG